MKKKSTTARLLQQLLFACLALLMTVLVPAGRSWGQTVQTFNSSTTWTCPPGVASIQVEAWGGGGGGGGSNSPSPAKTSYQAGGGGGGGSYVKNTSVAVVPGTIYTITVGAGGTAGTTTSATAFGIPGGKSEFSGGLVTTITASGGTGGSGGTSPQAAGFGGVLGGVYAYTIAGTATANYSTAITLTGGTFTQAATARASTGTVGSFTAVSYIVPMTAQFNLTNANSDNVNNSIVTVSSTASLAVGMTVIVTSATSTGSLAYNTTIQSITNSTTFVLSAMPTAKLVAAAITAYASSGMGVYSVAPSVSGSGLGQTFSALLNKDIDNGGTTSTGTITITKGGNGLNGAQGVKVATADTWVSAATGGAGGAGGGPNGGAGGAAVTNTSSNTAISANPGAAPGGGGGAGIANSASSKFGSVGGAGRIVLTYTPDAVNYYYDGTGPLNDLTNWGTNPDGSGTNPANFTADLQAFIINKNATTAGTPWTVSGSSSKIVVGEVGTPGVTLTIASDGAITGIVDITAASSGSNTLVVQNTLPTFGTLHSSSVVDIQSTAAIPVSNTYGTVSVSGSGVCTITGSSFTTFSGNLLVAGGTCTINSAGGTTTVSGNVSVTSGTLILESTTANSKYVVSGNLSVTGSGGITTYAASGSSTCTLTLSGSGKTLQISGTGGAPDYLKKVITFTVSGSYALVGNTTYNISGATGRTFTITGSLDISGYTLDLGPSVLSGTITDNASSTLKSSAATTGFPVRTYLGTVQYSSLTGGQTIINATAYNNLILDNTSGTNTLAGTTTVGGTLTLASSGSFAVGANTLSLNGASIAGTPASLVTTSASSISFGGSAAGVNIPSSVTALNNLTINNANGVTLNSSITAAGTLTFTSGKVTLGTNSLSAATITGGSSTAYAVTNGAGVLKRTSFTGSQVFPIGPSTTVFSPATLNNTASARDFSVKVGTSITNPTAVEKVGLQWDIAEPLNLSSNNVNLIMQWPSSAHSGLFNAAAATEIAYYDGAAWVSPSLATVAGSDPYTATVNGYSNFSSLVVQNSSAVGLVASVTTLPAFSNTAAGSSSTYQSFTLSGANLAANDVTITAPSNFSVSADDISYSGTITISPTGGSVNKTVYVKYSPTGNGGYTGNVTITNALVATQNIAVSGYLSTFYYKSASLATLSNWSGTSDGSGTSVPNDFTTAGMSYKILKNAITDVPLWNVAGTGSKIVVGDPSVPGVTLTIASGFDFTTSAIAPVVGNGSIDIAAASSGTNKVYLENAGFPPAFGTMDANSEVHYRAAISTATTKSYGKIYVENSAVVTFSANFTVQSLYTQGTSSVVISASPVVQSMYIQGTSSVAFSGTPSFQSLTVDAGSTLTINTSGSPYAYINSGGKVTINGTMKSTKAGGIVSFGKTSADAGSNTGTAIQFFDAETVGTNFILGSTSTIEYTKGSSATTQNVTPRTDYANLKVYGADNNKSFSGATTVSGTLTLNTTGTSVPTIASGTLTINGTLILSDTLVNSGSLTMGNGATITMSSATNALAKLNAAPTFGSSVNVVYNGTVAQTTSVEIPAISTVLGKLTMSNSSGVTLGGAVTANDTLLVTTGTLTTGSNNLSLGSSASAVFNPASRLLISGGTTDFNNRPVTFKSDNTGSASLGQITGTLSNATNVTVERFIRNNGFRSWRLLSVPTYGSQTINGAWQEGNTPMGNITPGYGTLVTGTTTALGFDDVSNYPGMLSFNGTNFVGIPRTTIPISTNKAYFLYVRGDRTEAVGSSTTANTSTTLRTTGTLYQGTQTSEVIPADSYALIGNPYPSAIDFGAITRTDSVNNTFYIWDSKINGGTTLGAYQTFSETNSFQCPLPNGSFTQGAVNKTIQSGQAFFVKTGGASGTVSITESSKIASTGTTGYKLPGELVKIDSRLYSINTADTTMADANVVVFDNAYSNAVDGADASKFSNAGENLAIQRNAESLVIEGRKPVTVADTIYFKMWNMKHQTYQLEFVPQNLGAQNLTARLEDSYLNTSTPVDLSNNTLINFTVNTTAASYASNRFRIVFAPSLVLPVSFQSISASRKASNVQVNWKLGIETNVSRYEVERSTDGSKFIAVGNVAATGASAYSFTDIGAPTSNLFYRIRSIGTAGEVKYSSVVKVGAESSKPSFAVVPNPVVGAVVNIQFGNQAKGVYQLRLINAMGQQVTTTSVSHPGGFATHSIGLPTAAARGTYQLEITAPDKSSSFEQIFVNNTL